MTYFHKLWTLPSPSVLMEVTRHLGMSIPLFAVEFVYIIVQQYLTDPDSTLTQDLDPVLETIWAQGSFANTDSLYLVSPSDEDIIEALNGLDKP